MHILLDSYLARLLSGKSFPGPELVGVQKKRTHEKRLVDGSDEAPRLRPEGVIRG